MGTRSGNWNHQVNGICPATLYYVQRDGAEVVLMAADPTTGQATPIETSRQPLPDYIGYYSQGEWEQWLTHRPSAQR